MFVTTRPWPWGLAFVRDSEWSGPPPEVTVGEGRTVHAVRGEVAINIRHEIDGHATLEISKSLPTGLTRVHDGELEVPSGVLVVGDAADEVTERVSLPAGTWETSIWVDNVEYPGHVVVCIGAEPLVRGESWNSWPPKP